MEKYIYQREIMAKPATKGEAEELMKCKVANLFYGNDGYLVKDIETNEMNWLPKTVFEKTTVKVDTPTDRLKKLALDIEATADELRGFNKLHKPSMAVRAKIYSMTRRLMNLKMDCHSLMEVISDNKI